MHVSTMSTYEESPRASIPVKRDALRTRRSTHGLSVHADCRASERGGAASRRRRLSFQTDCLTVERPEWSGVEAERGEGGKRKADERE